MILKAKELSIGNFTKQGEIVQLRDNYARVEYWFENNLKQSFVDYENLEPIKLTNQLLLNQGFKKSTKGFLRKRISKRGFLEVNIEDKRTIIFFDGAYYVELKYKKYIHQVQNLFYELTT